MPTMAHDELFGILLCVHADKAPEDAEWDRFVDACAKHPNGRCLVWTEQAGPTPKQRNRLAERTKNAPLKTAVCLDSTIARGIVTAVSWFNSKIQAFSKSELEAALKYLEVPSTTAQPILTHLKKMRSSLS
jgi:hypothetical protein